MKLRVRQRFGKYKILRCLGEGGFATVYEALDSLEKVRVALKVPHSHEAETHTLAVFRTEARTQAKLDHPNILPLKNAEFIDGHLVLVSLMGAETLGDRMRRRIGLELFLGYADQMLAAVAHAHEQGIIHCDLKPENMILFEGGRLRLTDFGIAKASLRTIEVSGSGTIGYMAPDQALGKASFRSDVFSLGLILYEMLGRHRPEFPFDWPPAGIEQVRRRVHPDFVELLRAAVDPDPRRRWADAGKMYEAFLRLVPRVRSHATRRRKRRLPPVREPNWKKLRFREFKRSHRGDMELDRHCPGCEGPMSEAMAACPWCGRKARPERQDTRFPDRCKRCHRGRKLDWAYCAWCHGKGFDTVSEQSFSDRRYVATCTHRSCKGPLMPFMRYCPWCRRKVTRSWKLASSPARCPRCKWGVAREYWDHCPWCTTSLNRKTTR